MFCPNCGTQNPDSAQTCSKCSFHLKSAAAPKFKGTMLMMNQPGPLPGVPPTPAPRPPAAPPPPGAGHAPSRLRGTMVGVAPMAGGGGPLAPSAAPPPPGSSGSSPAPPNYAPHAPPVGPPFGDGASALSPPAVQTGVNPLGGTVAADAGVFAAFAAQQHGGIGPPGAPPPDGAAAAGPPGAVAGTAPMAAAGPPPPYPPHGAGRGAPYVPAPPMIPYGAPPQVGSVPYGLPPPPGAAGGPPFGSPPGVHGGQDAYAQRPSPLGYGPPGSPPAAGSFGQPVIPFVQHSEGGVLGTLKSGASGPVGPTRRNAMMTLVLPAAVVVGGFVLGILLAFVSPPLGRIGSLVSVGGSVWGLLIGIQMIAELRSVTQSESLAWWPLIVPVYGAYFAWIVVPQEVAKAKELLAVRQPPRSIILYVFLWPFALASDLNDMVR